MLSLKLPTIQETVTLNGMEVPIYPLPLFFRARVQRIYRQPADGDGTIEDAVYWFRYTAIEIVEYLGLSGEIIYQTTAGGEVFTGRPAWGELMQWAAYAEACGLAVEQAGITGVHVDEIRTAAGRLDKRQIESLQSVGNS